MHYKREIDGLRAVAVLSVMLFHAGFPAFGGGFVGVDVFFVISGYLIASIIFSEQEAGNFSIVIFYQRRARRILPALFFVMAVCIPFAWFWLMPYDIKSFSKSIASVILFSSNFQFLNESGYFDANTELKPLLHTWSLAVEEQYYFFFPIFVGFLWKYGKRVVLFGVFLGVMISLIVSQWSVLNYPSVGFFSLHTRAWELLLGALVALKFPIGNDFLKGRLLLCNVGSLVGFGMLAYAIFIFNKSTPFPGLYALIPTVGAVLLIVFSSPNTVVGHFLRCRPMVSIGLMSYSLYLWHQPIFALVKSRFHFDLIWVGVFLFLLSFLLGYLTWRFVEQPFRKGMHAPHIIFSGIRVRALHSMLFVIVILLISSYSMYMVARNHKEILPGYIRARSLLGEEFIGYLEKTNARMPCKDESIGDGSFDACRVGVKKAIYDIVVWGDSLSGALAYGLNEELLKNNKTGLVLFVDGCPPVLGMMNPASDKCRGDVHGKILKHISELPGAQIVIIHGNIKSAIDASHVRINDKATDLALVRTQMMKAKRVLNRAAKQMVLLEQGPTFSQEVAFYYLNQANKKAFEELSIPTVVHGASLVSLRSLASDVDLYIGAADFFCDTTKCPARDAAGRMIIYDNNHVTKEYAVRLARYALERLASPADDRVGAAYEGDMQSKKSSQMDVMHTHE